MIQLSTLEGKVAWVTGASRGIGKTIALTLGQMGATVVGTATSDEGAAKISLLFEEHGIKGYGKKLDLFNPSEFQAHYDEITQDVGAPAILVNNAGITRDNLLVRMKDEQWNEIIQANLTGVFHLSKLCLKAMMKTRWGRIINISSVVGVTGNAGQANYAAAKAGVIGFAKSLAQEVGSRGITVNVVAPGFIETDMTDALSEAQKEKLMANIPLAKLGQTQDIANAVAFLASEQANYITGETLHVNGGMFMA